VLVVIEGSEPMGRIIQYAIDLARNGRPLELVLLGVARAPPDGRLRGYGSFKRDEVHARLKESIGERAVSAAARRFDREGIAHKERIEIGDPVETILRVADEEGSDILLIGARPAGAVQRWLPRTIGLSLATVTNQVAQSANIPVVVIK
jgi:nucleotide-binding universal stress UspA family protein